MFERRTAPLLPRERFIRRMLRSFALAGALIGVSLGLGILGYHLTESLGWLDSLLNASMILAGMGPVHNPQTVGGKWFASFYALFSGIAFLSATGVLVAPVAHRILHHFHMMDEEQKGRAR